jgi:4-amino-4-deoxy-L-arabinose transferase-like glycosyltransferase
LTKRAAARRRAPISLHAAADPASPRVFAIAALALVTLVTALLLAIALGPHSIGDYFAETDFYGAYAEGARLIQEGRLDPARYQVIGPVYDLVLAGAANVIPDRFVAAELIAVGAAAATLALWYGTVTAIAGPPAAFWTVAFLAVNPYFLRYGYSATTDGLAVALISAGLFLLIAWRSHRAAPLLAGLCAGLATLTRYNAGVLVPVAIAYLLLARPAAATLRSRLPAVALFLAGFAGLVVPFWIAAAAAGESPGAKLYHNIAYEVFARARGLTWDQYAAELEPEFHSLGDVIRRDPGLVLGHLFRNAVSHLRLDLMTLLGWPAALAAIAGLLVAARDRLLGRFAPLAAFGALVFLSLVPVQHSTRYSLPLLPIYLALAGIGIGSRSFAMQVRGFRLPLKWVAGLLVLALTARFAWVEHRFWLRQLPVEVLSASASLAAVAAPGDKVMARKPHIAYYSGLDYAPMPLVTELAALGEQCRAAEVDYLFFSWVEARARPELIFLLDSTATVPGLERLAYVDHHPAAVYRVAADFGTDPPWLADPATRGLHIARGQSIVYKDQVWETNLSLGAYELGAGRPAAALEYLARVRRRRPNLARGWVLTGEAQLALGKGDSAVAAFRRALALEPANPEAHAGLEAAARSN